MPFVPVVLMGSLVFTVINFLKNLINGRVSPVVTQLVSWVGGWIVVLLVAHSDYADSVHFGDHRLDLVNGWSQLFIGLMVASLFGVVKEGYSAIDNSDSAVKPPLVHRGGTVKLA